MKLSLQRFSILGLVLMGVSAVTAAVLPSNNKSDATRVQGSLTFITNNVGGSCTPTGIVNDAACDATANTGTTLVGDGTVSNKTTFGD